MFSLTRFDNSNSLFHNTNFNDDIREVLKITSFWARDSLHLILCSLKGSKRANPESNSCNHLGAFYLTYCASAFMPLQLRAACFTLDDFILWMLLLSISES